MRRSCSLGHASTSCGPCTGCSSNTRTSRNLHRITDEFLADEGLGTFWLRGRIHCRSGIHGNFIRDVDAERTTRTGFRGAGELDHRQAVGYRHTPVSHHIEIRKRGRLARRRRIRGGRIFVQRVASDRPLRTATIRSLRCPR